LILRSSDTSGGLTKSSSKSKMFRADPFVGRLYPFCRVHAPQSNPDGAKHRPGVS
jgi:hypothetical protein